MLRLADFLRSILFYMVFYGGSVMLVLLAAIVMLFSPAGFVRMADAWSSFHRCCVRYLLKIEVRIEGAIPSAPVLIALKHESFFEAIDLPHLLKRPAVFAKAELLRIPLWGNAGKHYGLIGVERDQGAKALRAMVAAAKLASAEHRPLAIFPEGTRVAHGQERELQAGFAGLYKLLALPVVPVAVDSGPLYHQRWKRRGIITYRIGTPIAPGLPRDEIEAQVLAAINVLNR